MRKLTPFPQSCGDNTLFNAWRAFSIVLLMLIGTTHMSAQCNAVSGTINGSIYQESIINGIFDGSENGLGGILVQAFDSSNAIAAQTTTSSQGAYSLSGLTNGTNYRIEFQSLGNNINAFQLASSGTSIQFADAPACNINYGLLNPSAECGTNPEIVLACFVQDDIGINGDVETIIGLSHNFDNSSKVTKYATKDETGSIWGLDYSLTQNLIYSSAFVKQYSALTPHGLGAIFTTTTGANPTTNLFVDLATLGVNVGSLSVTDQDDCDYGAQVGKMGLGGLAVSDDGAHVYVVNIANNTLVRVPTSNANPANTLSYNIPDPGCSDGDTRAFALNSYQGKFYVGVTCTAESSLNSANSSIHVYEFDPGSTAFSLIFSTNYNTGHWYDSPSNSFQTMHWLTDLDFTDDGNMLLSLSDRVGHRFCSVSGRLDQQFPDLLMAWNNNGVWTLENNGTAGALQGSGVGNSEGPGGGEFFGHEFWPSGPTYHPETALGSIYTLPGTNQVISATYDPHFNSYSGGLHRYDTRNGSKLDHIELYIGEFEVLLGKATGFGDISSICPPQDIEIGNYVWDDQNSNGVQDAGEQPFSGLGLHLYDQNCNLIASTTTDNNGNYLFNASNVDRNNDGVLDGLVYNQDYYIVLDDANYDFNSMIYTIDGELYTICSNDVGMGSGADLNDSDAVKFQNICSNIDGHFGIPVTQNLSQGGNHGFDIGVCLARDLEFDLALMKTLSSTSNSVQFGDDVTFTITVINQGDLPAATVDIADHIPAAFDFNAALNPGWALSNGVAMTTISNLGSGQSQSVNITLTVNGNSTDFVNFAEIAGAFDSTGNQLNDIDSTADMDPDNDVGGDVETPTDDLVNDDGTIDEDDHDPAMVYIFDLALRKTIQNPATTYLVGDIIEFKITVFNQGNIDASNVEVVDYLPQGLSFDASLNPSWSVDGAGNIVYAHNADIPAGASISIPFFVEIPPNLNPTGLVNEAEISSSDAVGFPNAQDFDSNPDLINSNDNGGLVGGNTDNLITDNGGLDEDDHDPASFNVDRFDLALIKTTLQDAVAIGDTVTFTITVFNQGSITANNIGIVDYIPSTLTLVDPDWTLSQANGQDVATYNINLPGGLAPNGSIDVDIDLEVLPSAVGLLVNVAEISSAEDLNGNDFSGQDADSFADMLPGNDVGGLNNSPTDNSVDSDSAVDEDDEDPAAVFVVSTEIATPCNCLNNATGTTLGQFYDEIILTGPTGQTWFIQNVSGLSDYTTISNTTPSNATGPAGFVLEEFSQLNSYVGLYYLRGVHNSGAGYSIQLTNGEGNFQNIVNPGCTYETPLIDGLVSVCSASVEEYTAVNPIAGVTYTWDLNGTTVGTGTSTVIDFNGLSGTQTLTLTPSGGDCLQPSVLSIEVGMTNGIMSCLGSINVSLGTDCTVTISPGMLMTNEPTSGAAYGVMLTDANGNPIAGNVLDGSYVGQEITAKVIDGCSGNSCWGTIVVEDKLAPVILCEDITISCRDMLFYPGPLATDNCDGDVTVELVSEIITPLSCNVDYIQEIQREYRATDSFGNESATCMQTILLERISLEHIDTDGDGDLESPVMFPPNFSMTNMNPLTCGNFIVDDNGMPSPTLTGVPSIDGEDLYPQVHFFCNISTGYTDEIVSDNACLTKILRTWTVAEWWCTGGSHDTFTQLIEITDNQDPVITCPANLTVNTSGLACSGIVNLPVPTATDICSPNDIRITVAHPNGFIDNFAGGAIELAAGIHTVTYAAYDACGNSSTCAIEVDVVDGNAPVAICDQNTTVGLNLSGEATVFASVFDDGSFDECFLDQMEVLRMDGAQCGSSSTFSESVTFCCEDVGETIQVMFRVSDLQGNTNTCMVNVEVQDKFAPVISCPADMTITCGTEYDINDLDALNAQFGPATATDVCQVAITSTAVENVDQCGVGTIRRNFRASDANGFSTCSQTITIFNPEPFTVADIVWPLDLSTTAVCMGEDFEPENLPFINGFPQITEDQCDLVGITHEDQTFLIDPAGNSCFKIVRTWSVIDWCQFDGLGAGIYTWDQTIEVSNVVPPTIDGGCEPMTVFTFDESCESGFVEIILTASDDCTPMDMLPWSYQIDLNSDGTVDIMDSGVGGTLDLSGNYPLGTHTLIWVVEDRCGNTEACTLPFTIINNKPPTAYCISGIAVSLQPWDLDGDGIPDTEKAELCVQNVDNGSFHTCGYPIDLSFSADTTDNCIIFDCDDLGLNVVQLWVTDINGNTSFCETTIDVQDNNDVDFCDKFDLALSNVLNNYDDVNQVATFDITVCNQGNGGVTELEVTAYIPAGYTLNDPAWTLLPNGDATMIASVANGDLPAGGLTNGNCHVKQITLDVITGQDLEDYILYAEITD